MVERPNKLQIISTKFSKIVRKTVFKNTFQQLILDSPVLDLRVKSNGTVLEITFTIYSDYHGLLL